MRHIRLNQIGTLLGSSLLVWLLLATMAAATCSESGGSLAITGNTTINLGDTQAFQVENTGSSAIFVNTEDLPNPGPGLFDFSGAGCLGNRPGGSTCTRFIKCTARGTGSYSVTASGGLTATVTLRCD